jgi:hypothetical protein
MGADTGRNFAVSAVRWYISEAVSASYGRFNNGACMPVSELGSKILG